MPSSDKSNVAAMMTGSASPTRINASRKGTSRDAQAPVHTVDNVATRKLRDAVVSGASSDGLAIARNSTKGQATKGQTCAGQNTQKKSQTRTRLGACKGYMYACACIFFALALEV